MGVVAPGGKKKVIHILYHFRTDVSHLYSFCD